MRAWMTAVALVMALPVAGCGGESDSAQAGSIPLTIKAPDKTHVFTVEVARTPEEQAKGLMFRTSLPEGGGMLFPFEKPRFASFWMKNTLIPLDMLFIRADGSIDRIAENTIPENLEPVVSGGEVSAVLELAGGTAAKLGIDESAVVTWNDK
ncbi:DUF192 domain-containing protein [Sphingopyxis sp. OPL5]|uniref:DUF192 domain-containing protein n=1 Tax=Sphingopyxis sp. OPL5 TaxID=2486273 RepID=UPI00164E4F7C|nr:DUF192 domain-containing protein [Sphingopyxis sp. OPL5]QNO25689.1 DUF192 domain-containing protein [Sphingopyxis sp. OPL5]